MNGMKLSVSIPDDDVAFLDSYVRDRGLPSRSAALHEAVRLLRASELAAEYGEAWAEWSDSGEESAWDVAAGDGVIDAAR